MSEYYAIVCDETRKQIMLGQGWGEMQGLWVGNQKVSDGLIRFLNEHRGKSLRFVCLDKDCNDYAPGDLWNYQDYGDPESAWSPPAQRPGGRSIAELEEEYRRMTETGKDCDQ